MRPATLLLALGGVALVLLFSTSPAKGSVMPSQPKLVTNPSNGNPISQLGSAPALSQSQLAALCQQVGFPAASIAKAVALATRESGGHPGAIVDTRGMTPAQLQAYWGKKAMVEYSVGLWQVNILGNPQFANEDLTDPVTNAQAALALSHGGTTWAPWGG